MKPWPLLIYFVLPVALMGVWEVGWEYLPKQNTKPVLVARPEEKKDGAGLPKGGTGGPSKPVPADDSKVAEIAKGFIENQTSLALAALGGVAATLFSIIEKLRLTRRRQRCIAVSISFFASSLLFGYLAAGAILRQLSEIGTVLIDSGDFHIASSMQFIAIIGGAASYSILVFDLIQDPKRRTDSD